MFAYRSVQWPGRATRTFCAPRVCEHSYGTELFARKGLWLLFEPGFLAASSAARVSESVRTLTHGVSAAVGLRIGGRTLS